MDKNTKKALAFMGVLGVSIASGIYTQTVSWDPTVRFVAHAAGGMAVPGLSSIIASSALGAYEQSRDKREAKKLQKEIRNLPDHEQQRILNNREPYKMNPKLYKNLMRAGMIIGSLGYMGFSASWEAWQYSSHNVFQIDQYLSDMLGPVAGIATIGTIDFNPLLEKFNNFESKLKNGVKSLFLKDKTKENIIERESTQIDNLGVQVENIIVDENLFKDTKEADIPVWDMRNYTNNNNNNRDVKQEKLGTQITSHEQGKNNENIDDDLDL